MEQKMPAESEIVNDCLERIVLALRGFYRISLVNSKNFERNFKVTTGQLICLRAISQGDGITLGEISKRTLIKPATITGIVDRLESKGLVRRNRSMQDRRKINIEITDAGRELVEAAPEPTVALLKEKLARLKSEELVEITASVEKLHQLLEQQIGVTDLSAPAHEDQIF